ncbi:MAG: hypothetical protein U0872_03625 [Planctomycetaceae bacterium]
MGLWLACAFVALAGGIAVRTMHAQHSEVAPATSTNDAIELAADWSQEWKSGDEFIGVFRGHCEIIQQHRRCSAEKMVVTSREKSDESGTVQVLTVYLEDRVVIDDGETTRPESTATFELETQAGVTLSVRGRQLDQPAEDDALYRRALKRRRAPSRSTLEPTQFTVEEDPGPIWQGVPLVSPQGTRHIRVFPRSAIPFDVDSRKLTNRTPPEQVTIISGGVTVLVDGIDSVGTIDLSADRVIIWTDAAGDGEFSLDAPLSSDAKYQVYLEGNIVVRQGDNFVTADRAFYDIRDDRALVLNADLTSFIPSLGATVRVHADRLRQYSEQLYQAQNAWVTTSEYGKPGFRLQAGQITLEQRPGTLFGNDEPARVDPRTGQVLPPTHPWVTATDTTLFVGDVPLFYSPYFSGTGEDPQVPLQSVNFQQDRIFGSQLRTKWDAFQLFGLDRPDGVLWNVDANYLSYRGPMVATDGNYRGIDQFGNPYEGFGLASYIHDDGLDNLGLDRRSLIPASNDRGRALLRHKWFLSPETIFQGEVGYVSDRNYLEQYYEREFDTGKDQETLGYLKHTDENWSWSALVRPQTNPFEYNTQWLPRGDVFALGEPIGDSPLNWSMHSSIGYAALPGVQPPTDPNDLFSPIPYYISQQGLVAQTRHEINAPFNVGALKIIPYALGEAAYWGDSFDGNDISRLYGRTGLRPTHILWRAMPYVQNEFFNLNGLAHKMVFTADYGLAGSTQPLSAISQWNELDDNSQERFRERLLVDTFGGVLPPQFESRFYAVRSAAATSVSAPYNELLDTQNLLQLGWNQRLQTKVGPPDRQRLKDWMTLDLGVNVYPAANRDDFGQTFGLLSSRYAWYVGDRTSILANTLTDFFDGGQQLWNIGVLSQRSYRGSAYLGVRQIKGGVLDSEILTASYSYVMTPDKWISTITTAYDLAESSNRGQAFTLTRIGADFLFHLGMNYDASKNNVGLTLSVEPKFGKSNGGISGIGVPQFGSLIGPNQ